jgi:hypothetical protein
MKVDEQSRYCVFIYLKKVFVVSNRNIWFLYLCSGTKEIFLWLYLPQEYDPDLPPELAAATGVHDVPAENSNLGKVDVGQSDIAKGPARVRPPIVRTAIVRTAV